MKAKTSLKMTLLLVLAGLICATTYSAAFEVAGKSAQNLGKHRIGYIEGGPYWGFTETISQAKVALDRLGWLDRVEFPPDAHVSPGWGFNHAALQEGGKALMSRNDIDLILAAGTDATQAMLAINNGRVPIIGLSVSDPLQSSIVTNEHDSGVDNFTVYFRRDNYKRLFRLFHESTGFRKLGLLYSPSPNGRVYSNVREAHQIARERGFEIVEYPYVSDAETEEECMAGLKYLVAQGMDAFYIPSLACFDFSLNALSSQHLLSYLMDSKIPTFAREGTIGVKAGALMGLSTLDRSQEGSFLANMIVNVLDGAQPRSLPMMMPSLPSLSLNLYTAAQIGFRPTFDLLTACDILFRSIGVDANTVGRDQGESPHG